MSVEVIAEIGENHMGNLELAKALVLFASGNGADAVKFQSYNAACIRDDDPEREWFLKVSLSDDDHFVLKDLADQRGVKFLSSPFSRERAEFLVKKLGLKELKIASCMLPNIEFLKFVNELGLDRVYLSTGLASVAEVREYLQHLCNVNDKRILHCVSMYPTPIDRVHMAKMRELQLYYGAWVGYSDHTVGVSAVLAAVAAGATVIEKHFTMDKNFKEGTDHALSVDPLGLRMMVNKIRNIERMLCNYSPLLVTEIEKQEWLKRRFIV